MVQLPEVGPYYFLQGVFRNRYAQMVDDVSALVGLMGKQAVELREIVPGDDLYRFDLAAHAAFPDLPADGLPSECVAPSAFYAPAKVADADRKRHPRPENQVEAGRWFFFLITAECSMAFR